MSDHLAALMNVGPPWWFGVYGPPDQVDAVGTDLNGRGVLARALRGQAMRTLDGLFAEISAALEFPAYFGQNWAALDECLADLSWLPAKTYVLLVRDSMELLTAESPHQFEVFLKVLKAAASEWAEPVEAGQPWDRSEVPFHVLFHETQDRTPLLQARFGRAGFTLQSLPPTA